MLTRWSAFIVWALVAAGAVYWGLRLFVQPQAAPAGTVVATAEGPLRGDLSRLLGADQAPTEPAPVAVADPRFQLLGVLSARGARAAGEGVALIAVDDRPPRAYRVGMVVDGDTVLQAVHPRGASLGAQGGVVRVALELPPPAAAATGSLPGAGAAGGGNRAGTPVFSPPGQPVFNVAPQRNPGPGFSVPPPSLPLPQNTGQAYAEPADALEEAPPPSSPLPGDNGNPLR